MLKGYKNDQNRLYKPNQTILEDKGEIFWRAFHGERFLGIRRADSLKDSIYKATSYESILSKPSSFTQASKHSFVITITILLQKKEEAWKEREEGGIVVIPTRPCLCVSKHEINNAH